MTRPTARAFAAARDEVAAMPVRSIVVSNKSGKWFRWYCTRCQRGGQNTKDAGLAGLWGQKHDREAHP